MKRVFVLALCLVSSAIAQGPEEGDEQAVLKVERDGCHAYQIGDTATLQTLFTADYTLTNSHGEISTLADDIADAKSGAVRYTMFENRNMKVRLYGDAAIVTGQTWIKGTIQGRLIDASFQFTDTLVRQGGHWLLAASHATRLERK
jgi:hypothetical protein